MRLLCYPYTIPGYEEIVYSSSMEYWLTPLMVVPQRVKTTLTLAGLLRAYVQLP